MPDSSTASPKAKTRRKLSMGLCPAEHGAVLSEHGAVSRMVSPGTKDKVVEASIAHHGAVPSGHGGVVRVLQAHLL